MSQLSIASLCTPSIGLNLSVTYYVLFIVPATVHTMMNKLDKGLLLRILQFCGERGDSEEIILLSGNRQAMKREKAWERV